jgi:predicted aspartyl protease
MILIDVEVCNNVKRLYELFEAIVDTGATFCVIGKHVSDKLGLAQAE